MLKRRIVPWAIRLLDLAERNALGDARADRPTVIALSGRVSGPLQGLGWAGY